MITTLTLNPAFDVHASLESFMLNRENLADDVSKNVGGKGINITRALNENGVPNTALIVCGTDNAKEFTDGLGSAGITNYKTVECPGRIRENITIHPKNGAETRLSFKGFACTAAQLEKIESLIGDCEYVTFTGSLPEGISPSDAEAFLTRLKARGIKLVIDSKSVSFDMLRRLKPYLIKPNEEEIYDYTGISDKKELFKTALSLNCDGIENAMISLGKDGAILATEGILYIAEVPEITAISTIGAGDSAIAGFLSANETAEDRLRLAVSYGTAACLTEGTNPPSKEDIEKISKKIRIKKILPQEV